MASEAQLRATKKWQEKMDELRFRAPKGSKDLYSQHANSRGESLTAFLLRAARETMERDLKEK